MADSGTSGTSTEDRGKLHCGWSEGLAMTVRVEMCVEFLDPRYTHFWNMIYQIMTPVFVDSLKTWMCSILFTMQQ